MTLAYALDEARKLTMHSTRRRIIVAYIIRSGFSTVEYFVTFSENQTVLDWKLGQLVYRVYPDIDNL